MCSKLAPGNVAPTVTDKEPSDQRLQKNTGVAQSLVEAGFARRICAVCTKPGVAQPLVLGA